MASEGILKALQPQQPQEQQQPMQPQQWQPGPVWSNGSGRATGPGYGGPGREVYPASYGPGPGYMGQNEIGLYGARPMGFMGPQAMWGNGGWGAGIGQRQARPMGVWGGGYGSDSDAHGSSMGYGNPGGGLW